jgi:MFS family permease
MCSGAGNPLGFIFGAVIAGIATQYASWRATYWVLAVIYAIVTGISFFTVPGDETSKSPFTLKTLKTFDLVGTALTVAGVGLLSAALGLGSDAEHGYATSYVIAFLVLGVVFIGTFIWWEYRAEYPLIPMHIWKDRNFSLLMAILALGFMVGFRVYILTSPLCPY